MDDLIEGYRRFRNREWHERHATYQALARDGQAPKAMVVACSDSRVDPAMIFGAGPGELFIVRNVANLVPPYAPDGASHATSAALEFGVRVLQVQHLIVLGHAMCGGIAALRKGLPYPIGEFLEPWMRNAQEAMDRALADATADAQTACELEAVKLSLSNLITFPWIRERVSDEQLRLHGATFDIRSGVLSILQPDGQFAPVSAPPHPSTSSE
jgi:carbonic anhydrase